MTNSNTHTADKRTKYLLVGVLAVLAFFASYGFAQARTGSTVATTEAVYSIPAGYGEGAGGCAGGCCGGGSSEPVEGATTVEGDVQTIFVDIPGGYSPNVIRAQAGVPLEITFAQSSGCTAEVIIPEFGLYADLTGGPQTLTLPALEPGTYGFSCGMEMVFGEIVVE